VERRCWVTLSSREAVDFRDVVEGLGRGCGGGGEEGGNPSSG
jgi:hypothetical protein